MLPSVVGRYYVAGELAESQVAHMDNFTRAHLVPDLWAVNRSTGVWMKVRDTCPTPRWVVDRVAKTYEVDGCNFNPGPPIPVEEGRRLDAAEVPHHP